MTRKECLATVEGVHMGEDWGLSLDISGCNFDKDGECIRWLLEKEGFETQHFLTGRCEMLNAGDREQIGLRV